MTRAQLETTVRTLAEIAQAQARRRMRDPSWDCTATHFIICPDLAGRLGSEAFRSNVVEWDGFFDDARDLEGLLRKIGVLIERNPGPSA